MESLLVSFSTVAIAEMGDRTQLLSLMLAAHYRRPWAILAGVVCATLANHALAGIVGVRLGSYLTPAVLDTVVGVSMVGMALWTLKPDTLGEEAGGATRASAFLATLVAFFIAEIGDKTQIATVALAAAYSNLFAVVAGTSAGMVLANAPVVFLGKAFAERLPLKTIHYVASGLFLVVGAVFIFRGLHHANPPSPPVIVSGNARFEFLTPSLVRMEYSPSAKFLDAPTAVVQKRDWYGSRSGSSGAETVQHDGLRSVALLVGPDELRLGEHVSLHGVQQLGLRRARQARQLRIERVELVEIAVPADRRARTAVAHALPVIESLHRLRRQAAPGCVFGESAGLGGNVVDHPVHPRRLRCARIGCVRIIDDQREAPGALRRSGPAKRRRYIRTFAGVLLRDRTLVRKDGGAQDERHRGKPQLTYSPLIIGRTPHEVAVSCEWTAHPQAESRSVAA